MRIILAILKFICCISLARFAFINYKRGDMEVFYPLLINSITSGALGIVLLVVQ